MPWDDSAEAQPKSEAEPVEQAEPEAKPEPAAPESPNKRGETERERAERDEEGEQPVDEDRVKRELAALWPEQYERR